MRKSQVGRLALSACAALAICSAAAVASACETTAERNATLAALASAAPDGRDGLFCGTEGAPDRKAACDRLLQSHPEPGPARIGALAGRAEAHASAGEFALANDDLETLEQLRPLLPRELDLRGIAETHLGLTGWAIRDFDKAISLKSDFADAYADRSAAYLSAGRFDDAIAGYDLAAKLDPHCAAIFSGRGVAHRNKGELALALQDYEESIKLDPELAAAFVQRANVYSQTGRYREAIGDYDHALSLKVDLPGLVLTEKGAAQVNAHDCGGAIVTLNEAIKLRETPAAYHFRGQAKQCGGDPAGAIVDFGRQRAMQQRGVPLWGSSGT